MPRTGYMASSVNGASASFQASSNSRLTHAGVGRLALLHQALVQAEERPRVARDAARGSSRNTRSASAALPCEQQRGAERLAHRIEPHRRLVVRHRVGERRRRCVHRRMASACDATRPGDARVEHGGRQREDVSWRSRGRCRRTAPRRAPAAVAVDQRRAFGRGFVGLAGARERDAAREVPPRDLHRMIGRRRRPAPGSRRDGRSAAAPTCCIVIIDSTIGIIAVCGASALGQLRRRPPAPARAGPASSRSRRGSAGCASNTPSRRSCRPAPS